MTSANQRYASFSNPSARFCCCFGRALGNIGDGEGAGAVHGEDLRAREVDGVARALGIPVERQAGDAEHVDHRLGEGPLRRARVFEAQVMDGAVVAPGFQQLVGDIQQAAVFGIDQGIAEIDGGPVEALQAGPPGKEVAPLIALREGGAIHGGQQHDGLGAERRQHGDRLDALAGHDGHVGGAADGTQDEIGIDGELARFARVIPQVGLTRHDPDDEAGRVAEKDARTSAQQQGGDGGGDAAEDGPEGLAAADEPGIQRGGGNPDVDGAQRRRGRRVDRDGVGLVGGSEQVVVEAVDEGGEIAVGNRGQAVSDVLDPSVKADMLRLHFGRREQRRQGPQGVESHMGRRFGDDQGALAGGIRLGEGHGLNVIGVGFAELAPDRPGTGSGGVVVGGLREGGCGKQQREKRTSKERHGALLAVDPAE